MAPPPRRRKGNIGSIVLACILIAATLGLAVGSRLNQASTTSPSGSVSSVAGGLPTSQAESIAAAVDHSVVDVNARLGYEQAAAAGTGMVLTANGEILTNNHVISGATQVQVTLIGGKTYTAKVLGTDRTQDVAVLQLNGASGLTPITTGDPAKLTPGQPIVAVGNAGGVGGTPSVVTGSVAALGQSVNASDLDGGNSEQLFDMIQINAPLEPGDSGGPLVTSSGQVVGMDTAAATDAGSQTTSNVGFAIPITRALSIAQQIASGHGSATVQIGLPGFLGVSLSTSNPGPVPGVAVGGVLPGSPADKAGMSTGDVITSIGGHSVDSPTALSNQLDQHHAGDKVSVGWVDPAGNDRSATITLIIGPAA